MASFLWRAAESYLVVRRREENNQIVQAAEPPRQQASYIYKKWLELVREQRLAADAVAAAYYCCYCRNESTPPNPNVERRRNRAGAIGREGRKYKDTWSISWRPNSHTFPPRMVGIFWPHGWMADLGAFDVYPACSNELDWSKYLVPSIALNKIVWMNLFHCAIQTVALVVTSLQKALHGAKNESKLENFQRPV